MVIIRPNSNVGEVLLDYALTDYRDFKIGSFIFDDNVQVLTEQGIDHLETSTSVASHVHYLKVLGFQDIGGNRYIKSLESQRIIDNDL